MSQAGTQVECQECDREYTVEFTGGDSTATGTRFCPRCGTKL